MVERIKKWRKTGKQNGQTSCEITITQLIVFCGGAWRHAIHQATAETLVRDTGGSAVALLSVQDGRRGRSQIWAGQYHKRKKSSHVRSHNHVTTFKNRERVARDLT